MTPASSKLSLTDKARLASEIVLAYVRVRRSLSVGTLPSVVERIRASDRHRAHPGLFPDARRDAGRLARAVIRTTAGLPAGSRCLTRSLVLIEVLARRGVSSSLVIAVRSSEEPGLDAHAWVELDGRPLLATGAHYGRLVTI